MRTDQGHSGAGPGEDRDDGLNPPANEAEMEEGLKKAREFLAKHPIDLRPNHGLIEISGF